MTPINCMVAKQTYGGPGSFDDTLNTHVVDVPVPITGPLPNSSLSRWGVARVQIAANVRQSI